MDTPEEARPTRKAKTKAMNTAVWYEAERRRDPRKSASNTHTASNAHTQQKLVKRVRTPTEDEDDEVLPTRQSKKVKPTSKLAATQSNARGLSTSKKSYSPNTRSSPPPPSRRSKPPATPDSQSNHSPSPPTPPLPRRRRPPAPINVNTDSEPEAPGRCRGSSVVARGREQVPPETPTSRREPSTISTSARRSSTISASARKSRGSLSKTALPESGNERESSPVGDHFNVTEGEPELCDNDDDDEAIFGSPSMDPKVILRERAQWNECIPVESPHSKSPQANCDGDQSPLAKHGRARSPEDDWERYDNDNDFCVERIPVINKSTTSKRGRDRLAETASWVKPKSHNMEQKPERHPVKVKVEAGVLRSSKIPSAEELACYPQNHRWSRESHYLPPESTSRGLALLSQPAPLQAVLKHAIDKTIESGVLVSAYPPVHTVDALFRDILIASANHLSYPKLASRFAEDQKLTKLATRVLTGRLSKQIRIPARDCARQQIVAFYKLNPLDPTSRSVDAPRLLEKAKYIYAVTDNGVTQHHRPFLNQAIISNLIDVYCTSSRIPSLADRFMHKFNEHRSGKPEITMAMVCNAATGVYIALDEFANGKKTATKDSTVDLNAYCDVYASHVAILNSILQRKPAAYHALMAELYAAVMPKSSHSVTPDANLEALDIDRMAS